MQNRKPTRLRKYDYSQNGYYFVTVCVQGMKCVFGDVKDGKMLLNDAGHMVKNNWNELSQRFQNVELDEFIIMPDHLHGIIKIVGAPFMGARNNDITNGHNDYRAGTRPAPTLGNIIGAFKSVTTNEYIRNVKNNNWQPFDKRLWQRNFYDHVIRTGQSLHDIRQYIQNNPLGLELDPENPANTIEP